MNKVNIIILAVACFAACVSAAVQPESRLYFSFPLGPAATTTAVTTTPAPGAPTTTGRPQLHIIPLGQVLGMLFGGILRTVFGLSLPNGQQATSISMRPLGQALAQLFPIG